MRNNKLPLKLCFQPVVLPGLVASVLVVAPFCATPAVAQSTSSTPPTSSPEAQENQKPVLQDLVTYIDTSFENASPLWYELSEDGTILVHLNYDHERESPNRAAGHIHFRIQAAKGRKLVLEFKNLSNIWNGRHGSVARELKRVVVSTDGKNWTSVPTESPEPDRTRLQLEMPADSIYVARVEPYRISDLDRFIEEIKTHPLIHIQHVGKTVQGRDLEIIRVGNESAPHHIFLRARSHPWETGGNYVVEGLVRRLLKDDEAARRFLSKYSVCIMPMANKDGVALGRTRFNLLGKDLNRQWDVPADPVIAPENVAFEKWLETEIQQGRRPTLALDFHNDGGGKLHLSRPDGEEGEAYRARMKLFEEALRQHTWFTEGSTKPSFRNPGSFGEGLIKRYGITAAILEFNCNHIAGLDQPALGKHWITFGEDLTKALETYLDTVKQASE